MTVFLVDDHEMMQLGLKTWIETHTNFKVCGTAGNSKSAMEFISVNQPDILIVDIDLGEESGFDLVKTALSKNPELKVLMYSMHNESGYIFDAQRCGAKGYITKASVSDEFGVALKEIAAGNTYFGNKFHQNNGAFEEAIKFLTPKEAQVFTSILKKLDNNQIAKELDISLHSVEIYVSRIYDKLGVHYRDELIEKFEG